MMRKAELRDVPFVLAAPERGRMVVKAANCIAEKNGITAGMVVADAKALFPTLQILDDKPELPAKLLNALAEWCLRYTPAIAVDMPDGLLLDMTGCAHLWGGEKEYLKEIVLKLRTSGYDVRAAIADTIGTAWAVARFGRVTPLINAGEQAAALATLPPTALRLEPTIVQRLEKLGLYTIGSFMHMPREVLRRRFGTLLLKRLDQALGTEDELIIPVQLPEPFQERLPCLTPVRTAKGIEMALESLLEKLSKRLAAEGKGLRTCILKCFRVDNNIQQISISTGRASRHTAHLCKLFEIKIATLRPDLGFELFLLEASVVEDLSAEQEALWNSNGDHDDPAVAELLDRLVIKVGAGTIRRYLPDEHYWPERSVKLAFSLQEKPTTDWRTDLPRPIHLLPQPESITVTVPIPDYPPMLFHYGGKLHKVKRADGPERIEQEWWIEEGLYRDYYCVEDENGRRYWLFRLGHYDSGEPKWFLHGFFA